MHLQMGLLSRKDQRGAAVDDPAFGEQRQELTQVLVIEDHARVVTALMPRKLREDALVHRRKPRATGQEALDLNGALRLLIAPAYVYSPGAASIRGRGSEAIKQVVIGKR